jgi:hypothetical protein
LGGPNEHLSIHWASRASDGILYPWAPPPSRPRVLAHHLHGSCECSRPSHSRWDPDKPAPHLKRSPPRRHVRGAGLRPGLLTPPTAGGRRSLVIALSGGDGGLRFHKAYRLHDFTRSPVPSGLHFLPNWPGVCQARRVFFWPPPPASWPTAESAMICPGRGGISLFRTASAASISDRHQSAPRLPGFWSLRAFKRLSGDFGRPVSASRNSVPGGIIPTEGTVIRHS